MSGRTTMVIFALLLAASALSFETPTPRAAISAAICNAAPAQQAPPLIINEYLADPPDGSVGDANGDGTRSASQDEFIELVNDGFEPLDIGGFTISDAAQVRFTFPAGAVIPAGEATVVFGGGNPVGAFGNAAQNGLVFRAGGGGLSLNNGVDSIIIKDHLGNEVTRRDYPAADGSANQSLTRSPDLSGAFVRHATVAESGGALFSPGARINGEPFTVAPRLTAINPAQAFQSDAPFAIEVQGMNFDANAVVWIHLSPVPTTFGGDNSLTATVPPHIAANPGDYFVIVVNANGNRSNAVILTIVAPPPVIHTLTPRVVELGSGPLTVFLQGVNFTPTSRVLLEETPLVTFFLSSRELAATVPASFLNTSGTRRLRVRHSDGQLSNEAALEIVPRAPRLTAISPQQVFAGNPTFTLEGRGANFTAETTVLLNQTPLATRFVSSSLLSAEVPAALITDTGIKAVAVQGAGGAISNEVALRVVTTAPVIAAISPEAAREGNEELLLQITGARFQPGAQARALTTLTGTSPGTSLMTTVHNAEELEARLPAALLQSAGSLLVRVENPDNGISNEVVFRVFIKDPLVINEYLADPPDDLSGDANGDGARSASQDEFIELVNRTDAAIDISGYRLFDADALRHVFAAGAIVPPFEAVVVFGGGTPRGSFGNAAENRLVFRASSGGLSLNNGGDIIRLEDAAGRTVQEIRFGAAEGGANESINRDPDGDGAVFVKHTRLSFAAIFSPGARATGAAFTLRPRLDALSPAAARVHDEALTLTINGANFQPGAVVFFAETALSGALHSDSQIEVRLGAELLKEGGFFDVRVQNPRSEPSAALPFLLMDEAPRLLSMTPTITGTGAENLEIVVTGERLQRGATLMLGNEKLATRVLNNLNAPLALAATAPAKFFTIATELELRVLNADTNLSNALRLRVENGPLITRLSRAKIKAGGGATEITLHGVAFAPDITLFVNDAPVPTRFLSDTSFTAQLPAALTAMPTQLTLQARHANGGRSNRLLLRVVP